MVECNVIDTRVLSGKDQNLGKRLVCASPSTWNTAIMAEVETQRNNAERYGGARRIDHIYLRPAVTLSVTNAADVFSGGFVLFPSAIAVSLEAEPPASGWIRCGISKNDSCPSWPVNVDGQILTVSVDSVSLPATAKKYKDWWWYPNQVLLIPAYAVDIVTSPIQLLMIMHSLSKIGR
jgi:hypothetical protein